jgi:signal transduction histidine kinase/CheY-like chemotaxis protein
MEQGKINPVKISFFLIIPFFAFILAFSVSCGRYNNVKNISEMAPACGIVIVLLSAMTLFLIYKIRQSTGHRELILKDKLLSEAKAEYQATLDRFQKANADLSAAKEKAEEADKLKTAFLANMSHEIRTPMNAIIGLSSFLTEPGITLDETREYVELINSSSRHLLTIIDDIVDISKIEAGQVNIANAPVEINKLLKEIYLMYKKTVELKKITLSIQSEKPDELLRIITDESRLKQIFCNLLNNAIKFTENGEIIFGYNIQGKIIKFFVKDTGIGIAPQYQSVIFDRFRKVGSSDSRLYGGVGLGLSISKGLMEKMGGTISVDSEAGKGSTFYFTIPLFKEVNSEPDSEKMDKPVYYPSWNNKTIMIVEDDENSYTYMRKVLDYTNVRLVRAKNGIEAIEMVNTHPEISLILMDIKMPLMDGLDATRQIKELRPEIKIIAQSAYAFNNDKPKAFEAGCDGYLTKPFLQKDLIEIIGVHIGER